MSVFAAMYNGGGKLENAPRNERDFYPTPPEGVHSILQHIPKSWGKIWEPCVGDGAIAKILKADGREVVTSDIVDIGYGNEVKNFFAYTEPKAPAIITNPPFLFADPFIVHAHKIGCHNILLLLKSSFWHAAKRQPLWQMHKPAYEFPLTYRLDFAQKGNPVMECSWFLWNSPCAKKCEKIPIGRALPKDDLFFGEYQK